MAARPSSNFLTHLASTLYPSPMGMVAARCPLTASYPSGGSSFCSPPKASTRCCRKSAFFFQSSRSCSCRSSRCWMVETRPVTMARTAVSTSGADGRGGRGDRGGRGGSSIEVVWEHVFVLVRPWVSGEADVSKSDWANDSLGDGEWRGVRLDRD